MPPADPLRALIRRKGVAVIDGGFSGELERETKAALDKDLWTAAALINNEEAVTNVHARFCAAGADVAITCSYQASFEGFARRGLPDAEACGLFRKSVHLAQRAQPAIVAASMGPYAAMLADGSEYNPTYAEPRHADMLVAWHRKKLEAILSSDPLPDYLAFETIPCAVEALAITALLQQEFSTRLPPAWITFSCTSETELVSGESFQDTVKSVLASDARQRLGGVGVNCVAPQHVAALLRTIAEAFAVLPDGRERPVMVVYPNTGTLWDSPSGQWVSGSGATHDAFCQYAVEWYKLGARAIGGCCQVSSDLIAAVARTLTDTVARS